MTAAEIYNALRSTGIPVAYYAFTKETAKPCPFICYFFAGSDDFKADNSNYAGINHLFVELYTDHKDFALEKTVQDALNAAGIVYERSEEYIDTESMYQITFESEVVITNG